MIYWRLIIAVCFFLIPHFEPSLAATQLAGVLPPGFQASQADWTDHSGVFLLSNNSAFGFGFSNASDSSSYSLVVSHLISQRVIWTANRNLVLGSSDKFVFGTDGNAYLGSSAGVIWSTNTTGDTPKAMELDNSGNLAVIAQNGTVLWQSFDHPTDTLISGQSFPQGARLENAPKQQLLSYLEIKSGDAILSVGYDNGLQAYWSMSKETRKVVKKLGGNVVSATIVANWWNFYDQTGALVWQFSISKQNESGAIWTAVLSPDGSIQFFNLESKASFVQPVMIPQTSCSIPVSCDPFEICSDQCRCPSALTSYPFCKPPVKPLCGITNASVELHVLGDGFEYSPVSLGHVPPRRNTSLDGCKSSCLSNCSCNVLFFDNVTNSCYQFDQIGSLQQANANETGYTLVIKLADNGSLLVRSKGSTVATIMVTATVVTLVIIFALVGAGFWYRRRTKPSADAQEEAEGSIFAGIGGMPVRYKFNDLKEATNNFSVKLGQGGFGSVYLGVEESGVKYAVKKLEGVGQGSKEFKAEVNTIGSIHHVHLVKLKGFCAEGAHRLLVYEYMGNGSLDRWIFNSEEDGPVLDWEKRYNIALGTAKGLAYLHDECDSKIIHCDIKPENVLLDDHFVAKVSDFGLAKLMNREQSYMMTTLRGTRGYLAPEWITNLLISEKSDVYSYGMLLLEMIGGRKNYEPEMSSETSYFPSYAFKKMEEGRLIDILDTRLRCGGSECDTETVNTAMRVALWCIQEDITLRPPMPKVVQMLQMQCPIPDPPVSHQTASRIYSGLIRAGSEDCNNTPYVNNDSRCSIMSATRLSGPR